MNCNLFARLMASKQWRQHYILTIVEERFRKGIEANRALDAASCKIAYLGWNPDNAHEPGRLTSSGSFLWAGCVAARRAAMEYLSRPGVIQVAVSTNQSRKLYIWNKHEDGSITGYAPCE